MDTDICTLYMADKIFITAVNNTWLNQCRKGISLVQQPVASYSYQLLGHTTTSVELVEPALQVSSL